ncbi:MAG TPA: helix-turn-helix domain-containing protein, partial [Rhodocyclaceae bacterium]|nr:helix-turn-helix domain-containing protein [Rhodocyclaceae bacterium]
RELENTMQRALILAPGDTVDAEHLLLVPVAPGALPPVSVAPVLAYPAAISLPSWGSESGSIAAPAAGSTNMKDLERQHILETLAKVGGSRKKAVELLGISERTLRYKLAQYREEGHLVGDD